MREKVFFIHQKIDEHPLFNWDFQGQWNFWILSQLLFCLNLTSTYDDRIIFLSENWINLQLGFDFHSQETNSNKVTFFKE